MKPVLAFFCFAFLACAASGEGIAANDAGPAGRVWVPGGSFLCHAACWESCRPSAKRGTRPDTGMSPVGFHRALSGGQVWQTISEQKTN